MPRSLQEVLQSISDVMFPDDPERCPAIDSIGYDGDGPLHVMAWRNDVEGVQVLIDAGADVNATGEMDETPLHIAVTLEKRVDGSRAACGRSTQRHALRVRRYPRRASTAAGRFNRPPLSRCAMTPDNVLSPTRARRIMLELRPTCENCNKPLPPDSLAARICTYECTFCATCVETVLHNVCPNCGGGFVPRPIRPSKNWNGDNYLGKDPASTVIKHRPVDAAAHERFAAVIKSIPPERR